MSRQVCDNFPAAVTAYLRRCREADVPFERAWGKAMNALTPRERGWSESVGPSDGQPGDSSPLTFLRHHARMEYLDPENVEGRPSYKLEGLL